MSHIRRLAVLTFILGVCISNLHAAAWFSSSRMKTVCKRGKCVEYCDLPDDRGLDDLFLQPGETFKSDKCTQIFCNADFSSMGHSCGVATVNGCTLSPDYKLKYPDCCNKICLDEDREEEKNNKT